MWSLVVLNGVPAYQADVIQMAVNVKVIHPNPQPLR